MLLLRKEIAISAREKGKAKADDDGETTGKEKSSALEEGKKTVLDSDDEGGEGKELRTM